MSAFREQALMTLEAAIAHLAHQSRVQHEAVLAKATRDLAEAYQLLWSCVREAESEREDVSE